MLSILAGCILNPGVRMIREAGFLTVRNRIIVLQALKRLYFFVKFEFYY